MKKFISFLLAALLLVSMIPTTLATNDYTAGTRVEYTANASENYTVTVPAVLAPGGSGTVTLSGTWPQNRVVTVTSHTIVTMVNNIKPSDQKVLHVTFAGIKEAGSNTGSQTFTETVSVSNINHAIFGIWEGHFEYAVNIEDAGPIEVPTKASLNDYTWEEIQAISQGDKELSEYNIAIGDTISDGTFTYYLVSDERDEAYDGLVFMFDPKITIPMKATDSSVGGYMSSDAKNTVDSLITSLPADLQDIIKPVTVYAKDSVSYMETVYNEELKLFLPALREMCPDLEYGGATHSSYDAEGHIFDWFADNNTYATNAAKIRISEWWFRTAASDMSYYGMRRVTTSVIVVDGKDATALRSIVPVFVIG